MGVSNQTTHGEVMERKRRRGHRNALLNQVEQEILMLKEQRVRGQEDVFCGAKKTILTPVSIEGNMENLTFLSPHLGQSSRYLVLLCYSQVRFYDLARSKE